MHNPTSVLENDTHKLLCDFDIQTDHLISGRRPDLIIINRRKKRTCKIVNFTVLADHKVKLKESEKRNKYLDLAWQMKNLWSMKVKFIPIIIGTLGTVTKEVKQGLEDVEIREHVEIHPNCCIIEIGQNTEKSPGDLRRLAVTQTQVKDHQLTLL